MAPDYVWDAGLCTALGSNAHVWAEDVISALETSFEHGHDPDRWCHVWSLVLLGLWIKRHGLT